MLRNFSFVVEDEIAGCAHPDYAGECDEALAELREAGISALVSLDECGVPLFEIADHDLHYLHLAIPDFGTPTLEQLQEFLAFVERERGEGRRVAVHCGAGYGRTGTMLACYLVSKGEEADKAISRVRRQRPGSIETPEQEEFIRSFAASLKQPAAATAKPRRFAGIRRKKK
jgi:atypical dual specificity phosphatase